MSYSKTAKPLSSLFTTKNVTLRSTKANAKYKMALTELKWLWRISTLRSSSENFAVRIIHVEPVKMSNKAGRSYRQMNTSRKKRIARAICIRIAIAVLKESSVILANGVIPIHKYTVVNSRCKYYLKSIIVEIREILKLTSMNDAGQKWYHNATEPCTRKKAAFASLWIHLCCVVRLHTLVAFFLYDVADLAHEGCKEVY